MSPYYRQRRSIFSGVLLILVGTLLLISTNRPEFHLWRLIYYYWPLLLILLGLAKVFDHFMATRTGEGRPPIITGGEVALIIVLFFFVGGVIAIHRAKQEFPNMGIDVNMDDMFDHPYDWTSVLPTVPVKPNEAISISSARGDISVHPSDDAKLHVIVHKSASGASESDARARADKVNVLVTPTGNGYQIQPQMSGDDSSHVRVDLEVQLPAQSNISAQASRGNITVIQMTGPVTLTSKNGNLDIHDITGDVSADISHGDSRLMNIKGNVRLDGAGGQVELSNISGDATIDGDFFGPIRLRKIDKTTRYTSSRTNLTVGRVSGQLDLDSGSLSASDLPGSIQLTTSDKDVSLENVTGQIELTSKRGDISVRFSSPPRDDVRITDASANITITLPAQSNFDLSAVSRSGDIDSDFQGPGLKVTKMGDTSVLQGSYGSHGPHITLNNTYGTIYIRKQ